MFMYVGCLLMNIMTGMRTTQSLDNNTAQQSTALSLTCPCFALAQAGFKPAHDSGTTQVRLSCNPSSDVWHDRAIVISSDSEVGPSIRHRIISYDLSRTLRQDSNPRTTGSGTSVDPEQSSIPLEQFVQTSAGLAGVLVTSAGVLQPLRDSP